MRAGQAFLAGVVALIFCLALAGRVAAADFNLSSVGLSEVYDAISEFPADCTDYPAASDSYVWTANLGNIHGDFKSDFKLNPIILAFVSKSCNPITIVTNTLEIPPGAATIKTDKTTGVVTITFDGAVPDFNTGNTANSSLLPFFDDMSFVLTYNPGTSTQGSLAPKTGTLQVSGNANLCDAFAAGTKQCLLLDIDPGDSDYDCACVNIPQKTPLDITSLF